jgi:DNA adenine methylase
MKYSGGKYRSAKGISDLILSSKKDRNKLISPFIGGAAVEIRLAPYFPHMLFNDISKDLILMWDAVCNKNWLPHAVSEEEYNALRDSPPSALRGFAGFGATFGGKWFGGYGRISAAQAHRNGGARTAAEQSLRVLTRDRDRLSSTRVHTMCVDYEDLSPIVKKVARECVVYADPPYFGTLGYAAAGAFDTQRFWNVVEEWASLGAFVFVSEESAPPNWECVRSVDVAGSMDAKNRVRTEKLFTLHTSLPSNESEEGAA